MQHVPPPDEKAPTVIFRHPDPEQEDRVGEVVMEVDGQEPPQITRLIVTTYWQPDDGERKAIANGAPVEVHKLGPPYDKDTPREQQVPQLDTFTLTAGEPPPDQGEQLLERGHVNRALGFVFAGLAVAGRIQYMDDKGIIQVMDASKFLLTWQEALESTRDVNSDGPSIADMALPSDVREDLG
jgi:hypothetical protein